MTIEQVSTALKSVGACFATSTAKFVSPDDGFGAKPTYHIHPDCSYPHGRDILRFSSIKEIQQYVTARKAAMRATDDEKAFDIMNAFWMARS